MRLLAKVVKNQDRVATRFVEDKKRRKGLLIGVWNSDVRGSASHS
jgi:hypothetical protein